MARSLLGVSNNTYSTPGQHHLVSAILGGVAKFPSSTYVETHTVRAPYVPIQGGPWPDPANYRTPNGLHMNYYADSANWSAINYPKSTPWYENAAKWGIINTSKSPPTIL